MPSPLPVYSPPHALSLEQQQHQHLLSPSPSSLGSPGFTYQQQHLLSPPLDSPGFPRQSQRHYAGRASGLSSPATPAFTGDDGHDAFKRQSKVQYDELSKARKQDSTLKSTIRTLRLTSRALSLLLSLSTLIPLALTIHKFLTTNTTYHTVPDPSSPNGTKTRTAWHADSKVWPTYTYAGIAATSTLLHAASLAAYFCRGGGKRGVRDANRIAGVASAWSGVVMVGNLVVWGVGVVVYRLEKDRHGVSDDLWGWTCSPKAKGIQREFEQEVDFKKFCTVQTTSWYTGLAQTGAALLTIITYVLVIARRRGKKDLKRYSQMAGQYPTDY